MTKQKLEEQLMDISAQMYYLAGSLQTLCRVINGTETEILQATISEDRTSVKAPQANEKEPGEDSKPAPTPEISLEKVRGVLADKSRNGNTDKVREIIGKYANRLSEIDPKYYPEVLKEAEELP